jgi:hypothetical protein
MRPWSWQRGIAQLTGTARSRRRLISLGAAVAFLLVYALLLYWFDSRDFYYKHFFDRGGIRHYEWLRLLFIFCFAWLVYAPGAMGLWIVAGKRGLAQLPAWERYPLGFLTGVGVWSIVLYALGLASLYSKPLAIGITVAVMLGSIPHLAACIQECICGLSRFRVPDRSPISATISRSRISIVIDDLVSTLLGKFLFPVLLLVGIVLTVAVFLLVKGLYPGGGHDYWNHYFPFYVRVVQSGSILPNDVWYHFYQSKGDVLYFLAMLLTDPLAPQLVTAGFVLCAACIVYALLRRISPNGLLPWIGVLLYFAFFIYTPGPQQFMVTGGWGDLEKEHEMTAALLLGVVWCMIRLVGNSDNEKRPWILGLHASSVATTVVTLQLGFLIGLYLTGYMVWFAIKRQWRKFAIAFFGGVSTAITIIVIFAINYELTGLILDQAILLSWPLVNLAKLAHWGPVFEAIDLLTGMLGFVANAASWKETILWLIPYYLRLDIWWPLVATGSIFAAVRFIRSQGGKRATQAYRVVGAMAWFAATVAFAAAFAGGRLQFDSFYRTSSFSYAPMLCLGLALWHFGIGELDDVVRPMRKVLAGGLIGILLIGITLTGYGNGSLQDIEDHFRSIAHNAAAFWSGRLSIAEAYQNQQGWSARLPWGGIYPGAEKVWRLLPAGTRIWSFHIWSYCMLPNCNFQGRMSFILSPQWPVVFFGTPERAQAVLRAEGLNFFFFTKEMPIEDAIVHAPLFSPDNIGKYLAVQWTDGTSYLLTWRGPNTQLVDEDFLAAYRYWAETNRLGFDADAWKRVADAIASQEAKGEQLHPFPLAWCRSFAWC